MIERKAGWYWVHKTGAWVPAYFYCNTWVIGDVTHPGDTFSITKVGSRITAPDESFKCVPIEPTEEMVDAASEMYMPFGDMALAIQAAIVYAPGGEGEQ